MEFSFVDPDLAGRSDRPNVIGYPSDPDGEFIINDPRFGEQVVHSIEFYFSGREALQLAIDGDESGLREHVVPLRDAPGWQRLVNVVGYAAINSKPGSDGRIKIRVRDIKETQPFRPQP